MFVKMLAKYKKDIIYVSVFIILLIIFLIGYRYKWYGEKILIKPVVKTLTKVIPVVKTKIHYKTLTFTRVKYIPKTEYQTITNTVLPKWANGKNNKIIAMGKIPPYAGQTLATAILNTKTGKGQIGFQQLPFMSPKHKRPFFALPNRLYIQGGYGYLTDKNGTRGSGIIGVGYKFLRIGNLKFKVKDNVYLNSENTVNFVGITAQYNF